MCLAVCAEPRNAAGMESMQRLFPDSGTLDLHHLIPTFPQSAFHSQHWLSCLEIFFYPVSLLFLLFSTSTTSTFPVSHKQGQAHTHNTHRLISFKDLFQELWLCGLERIQMLPCLFVFFFPPNTPTGCCIVDVKWFWCFFFLIDVSVTWAILAVYDKSAYWLFT